EDLFAGVGDQMFDLARAGAGEGHENVGHGHIDLRLFFLGRDDDRQYSGDDGHGGQQRRQARVLKRAGNAARQANGWLLFAHCCALPANTASGSSATSSPSSRPESTSRRSPSRVPMRTWRSLGAPELLRTNTARSSLRSSRLAAGTHSASRVATASITRT